MKRELGFGALSIALTCAACTGDDAKDPSGPVGEPAWVEIVQNADAGEPDVTVEVSFYSAAHDFFPGLALDECVTDAIATPTPPPRLDAGNSIRLISSSQSILLNRNSDGTYDGIGDLDAEPLDLEVDENVDLAPELADDALPAPRITDPLTADFEITKGAAYSIEWTGSGEGWETISFLQPGGGFFCRAIDDGQFTIPAASTALLNSSGNILFINVQRTLSVVGDLDIAGYAISAGTEAIYPFTAE